MPIRVRPESDEGKVKIKVVGVGGAGGNAVGGMVGRLSDVDLVAINTDIQALRQNRAPIKLQIGRRLTGGRGTGCNPATGEYAAREDINPISDVLQDADVVFITLGLGGGTGTGAGPVVAQRAREMGAIVIGFMTLPFDRMGPVQQQIAAQGLDKLHRFLHTSITVPNQRIYEVVPRGTTLQEAYRRIDSILHQGVAAVSDLLIRPGLENLDFADLCTIMENGGDGLIGVGEAAGEGRAVAAAEMCVNNPLMRREGLNAARNVLISIAGAAPDLWEPDEIFQTVSNLLTTTSRTFCGTVIDESLGDTLRVTVIATGLENRGDRETRVSAASDAEPGRRGSSRRPPRPETAEVTPNMFPDKPDDEFMRPAFEEEEEEERGKKEAPDGGDQP